MKKLITIGLILILLTTIGCSTATVKQQENSTPTGTKQTKEQFVLTEPVTISAYVFPAQKLVFEKYIVPAMKQKYPQMTIELVDSSTVKLEELIAADQIPDLFAAQDLYNFKDLGLTHDLSSLISKYQFDLKAIDPVLIESVRAYGEKGELYALPSGRSVNSLIYNKEIFDRFAVPYPKDGMTWDELISLARRMTRTDNGIQYYGLHPNRFDRMVSQLGLSYFDKDGKAMVTNAGWQKLAKTWKDIYEIPNLISVPKNPANAFLEVKNTAMILRNPLFLLRNTEADVNWDMVTFPTFENNIGPDELGSILGITSVSKRKDAAFQVLDYYFSNEFQMQQISDAELIPISPDPNVQKNFAKNYKDAGSKNLQSLFKGKRAPTKFEKNKGIAEGIVEKALTEMTVNNEDINTTLRKAEEQINKVVAELSAK